MLEDIGLVEEQGVAGDVAETRIRRGQRGGEASTARTTVSLAEVSPPPATRLRQSLALVLCHISRLDGINLPGSGLRASNGKDSAPHGKAHGAVADQGARTGTSVDGGSDRGARSGTSIDGGADRGSRNGTFVDGELRGAYTSSTADADGQREITDPAWGSDREQAAG
jgi:hypothetical protein